MDRKFSGHRHQTLSPVFSKADHHESAAKSQCATAGWPRGHPSRRQSRYSNREKQTKRGPPWGPRAWKEFARQMAANPSNVLACE